jgi:hypothetical protein
MMAISGCPPTDDPAKVPDNPAKVQANPERTLQRAPSARIRSAGISGLLVIKLVGSFDLNQRDLAMPGGFVCGLPGGPTQGEIR